MYTKKWRFSQNFAFYASIVKTSYSTKKHIRDEQKNFQYNKKKPTNFILTKLCYKRKWEDTYKERVQKLPTQ